MSWWFWSIWFHASTCTYAQVSCPAKKSAGPVHCVHFCRTLSPTVPTLLTVMPLTQVASSSSRLERTRVNKGIVQHVYGPGFNLPSWNKQQANRRWDPPGALDLSWPNLESAALDLWVAKPQPVNLQWLYRATRPLRTAGPQECD